MSIDTYFCFCCLSTNDLSSLFSSNTDTNHVLFLKELFSIKPSQDDEEDSYICKECAGRLKEAYMFKQQVFDTINILQVNGLIELHKIKGDLIIAKVSGEKPENEAKDGFKNDTKSDVEFETDLNNEEDIQDQKTQQPQFEHIKKEPIEIKKVEIIYRTEKFQQVANEPVTLELDSKKGDNESYVVADDLKCNVCMETLPNLYMYHRHMNAHFPNHICETCGKGFLTEKRLKRHMTSHDKGPFKCQSCEAVFTNYSTYNGHRQRKHSSQYHYACPHCSDRFPTYARRALHLTAAHAQHGKKYLCPVCGKAFLLAGNLSQHMRSQHLKIKRYTCKMCEEGSFYHKQDLVSHMSTHTGQNQFLCTVCNKSYPRKKSLKVHLLTHSDEKPFCCDACGKNFNQKCALLSHMKTHNGLAKKRRSKPKSSSKIAKDDNITNLVDVSSTNLVDLSPEISKIEDLSPKLTNITPVRSKTTELVGSGPAKVTNLVELGTKVTSEESDKVFFNCYKLFY